MVFGIFKKRSEPILSESQSIKPVVLVVLDGWGVAPQSQGNAIHLAKTPNMDSYPLKYPHGELIAAGESVGLPANEAGNSEIGHLTLGAGRVTLQSLMRINAGIKDGTFFDNQVFFQMLEHAKKFRSKLHLMGLVGSGEVHSAVEHFYALLEFCQRHRFKDVRVHLFTDGRDAPPKEAKEVVGQIEGRLRDLGVGQIASVSGRYFAMDRDRRWDRTERVYKAMVLGQGLGATSGVEAVEAAYQRGETDEFIQPFVVVTPQGKPVGTIDDNDAVMFFNFRIDRPRQLTMAFTLPEFENLKGFEFEDDPYKTKYLKKHGGRDVYSGKTFVREKWPKNVFFATMTEYQKNLPVAGVAFPPPQLADCLPEVLSKQGLRQCHLAESEKERMVTFYFDGLREEVFPGEEVVIVPSPKVPTYDKKPEMSAFSIVEEFKKALARGIYHFLVVNFANPDMVAHSGNMQATIRACEFTDKVIGEVVTAVMGYGGTVVITADHGNAEDLLTFSAGTFFYTTGSGKMNTEHSNYPVPVLVIAQAWEGQARELPRGTLADVAPTLLRLMNLTVPGVMVGRNLLE